MVNYIFAGFLDTGESQKTLSFYLLQSMEGGLLEITSNVVFYRLK